MKRNIQYKSVNNNSLQTNSVLFFVLVIFIIFAVIASIVAIVLEVKHKKNTDTETSKTSQSPSNLGLGGQNDMEIIPGTIFVFGGTSVPDGYLLCDGKDYSSIDYPDLYNVIGTTFGVGETSQSTDFNVPDLIDKYIKGGNLAVTTVEGQNSFTVKSENIKAHNPTIPGGYGNIPIVFNSSSGIKDWYYLKGKPSGDDSQNEFNPYSTNSASNGSNLTNALQIGNTDAVAIDNRPASITIMYIIKT